jgi:hypothetical protein
VCVDIPEIQLIISGDRKSNGGFNESFEKTPGSDHELPKGVAAGAIKG